MLNQIKTKNNDSYIPVIATNECRRFVIIVESSLSDQLSKKPERMQILSMIPVQFIFTSNSTRTCSAGRVLVMTQSPVVGDTNPYCGVM